MRIYRGLPRAADQPVALTIGNFDGVHRGHQAMLARLAEAADDLRLPAAVMTFEPHPREFFAPHAAPPRLTPLRDKLEALRAFGVTRVHIARFDAKLASLAPEAFIRDVLEQRIGVRWVLVGDDFRFGHKRTGDLATLRAHAARFSVETMHTVECDGERISSSAVRAALLAGDVARAARLLGRPYAIAGRVGHGEKLGRKLGFPTANLPLRHVPPLSGVYAVRVGGLPGGPRDGVASLGTRPTVRAGGRPLLEAFILDFDEPIYGRRIAVEFLHKLRDEARYPDLETLARKIGEDVAQARDWFHAANAA
ncbi:MAG: bifunctional riboflavin kinase/FAD synthetase [Betaproteobacteria bacterium]|nr:bifunctional riboflavin kinase/FAD synthetase [Betaproteobacteria bacterium]MDH5287448.1 bifunctional riboflavin kinase/FAD synthetase [Betaproteobacteria bacterium]